jgi:uncharacterized protein YggT (Ycf19 family)
MGPIDFILNLAGLLMWLSWRSVQYDPLSKRKPATLLGTLRPAEASRWERWHLLAVICGLLLVRGVVYWLIGSASGWVGTLDVGVISVSIPFHTSFADLFLRIIPYSFLSFGVALGVLYLWILLLSILAGPEPIHRLVRVQMGWVDTWPRWVKWLTPLVATALLWWLATWLLGSLETGTNSSTHLIPRPVSGLRRFESALVVGAGSYLMWKYVIAALLVLHLLNTYIYFGKHPFWGYVNATAKRLLSPLTRLPFPLRAAKVDFSPVVALAITFFAAEQMQKWLEWLYGRLSF